MRRCLNAMIAVVMIAGSMGCSGGDTKVVDETPAAEQPTPENDPGQAEAMSGPAPQ